MVEKHKNIVILGASPNKERYANKAIHIAKAKGFRPILVNPNYPEIDGISVFSSLKEVKEQIDYLSIYTSYSILNLIIEDIVESKAKSIILNPGSDSEDAIKLFNKYDLPIQQACTLVLLSTNQITLQ